jgi:hypothetical protein
MVYLRKRNTMGQMKKLLDTIFEIGDTYYPEDCEKSFEEFIREESLLYEKKELSLTENKTENHD